MVIESDLELEVEYRESRELDLGFVGLDFVLLLDVDIVNFDEDFFSILGGDLFIGFESFVYDLLLFFLYFTCFVRLRG